MSAARTFSMVRPTWARGATTDLSMGIVGGFLSGVAFIAMNSWFATTTGKPPLAPFMMIGSMVQGQDALMQQSVNPALGMVLHSVIAAILGAVFAVLVSPVRGNGMVALSGLVYGGLVYVIDFQVLGRFVWPQFQMTNQPFELAVHLVFGALLAVFLLRPGPASPSSQDA